LYRKKFTIRSLCKFEEFARSYFKINPYKKVIWQHGFRGKQNQTLLSIGNLQIEANYRIRIITNIEEINYESMKNGELDPIEKIIVDSTKTTSGILEAGQMLAYNLEIRKLQINDSGWYECQLNTKPTIKNYIFLKVLSKF
jgi:hypothetical protein